MNSFICFFSMRFWSSRCSFCVSLRTLASAARTHASIWRILIHLEVLCMLLVQMIYEMCISEPSTDCVLMLMTCSATASPANISERELTKSARPAGCTCKQPTRAASRRSASRISFRSRTHSCRSHGSLHSGPLSSHFRRRACTCLYLFSAKRKLYYWTE
jgi:hypothetical protein